MISALRGFDAGICIFIDAAILRLDANPPGPAQPASRVQRGGSWFYEPLYARSAFRYRGDPGQRYTSVGFRAARVQSGR